MEFSIGNLFGNILTILLLLYTLVGVGYAFRLFIHKMLEPYKKNKKILLTNQK